MAVIHHLSQYNGLSKGPILQLKHLHSAVPSKAPHHCITSPVISKTLKLSGMVDDWLKILIQWLEIKTALPIEMAGDAHTHKKNVAAR